MRGLSFLSDSWLSAAVEAQLPPIGADPPAMPLVVQLQNRASDGDVIIHNQVWAADGLRSWEREAVLEPDLVVERSVALERRAFFGAVSAAELERGTVYSLPMRETSGFVVPILRTPDPTPAPFGPDADVVAAYDIRDHPNGPLTFDVRYRRDQPPVVGTVAPDEVDVRVTGDESVLLPLLAGLTESGAALAELDVQADLFAMVAWMGFLDIAEAFHGTATARAVLRLVLELHQHQRRSRASAWAADLWHLTALDGVDPGSASAPALAQVTAS